MIIVSIVYILHYLCIQADLYGTRTFCWFVSGFMVLVFSIKQRNIVVNNISSTTPYRTCFVVEGLIIAWLTRTKTIPTKNLLLWAERPGYIDTSTYEHHHQLDHISISRGGGSNQGVVFASGGGAARGREGRAEKMMWLGRQTHCGCSVLSPRPRQNRCRDLQPSVWERNVSAPTFSLRQSRETPTFPYPYSVDRVK